MKYKLRKNYTKNPDYALQEILESRGVEKFEDFVRPSSKCELNPYDLENIELAADLLLKHLRNNSHICMIVDCD